MALGRSTRVNLLIGNGHFLSHFYALCLPPLFIAWQRPSTSASPSSAWRWR